MASDIILGLIIGIVLAVFLNPVQGVIFIIRGYRQQIAFLRGDGQAGTTEETEEKFIEEK